MSSGASVLPLLPRARNAWRRWRTAASDTGRLLLSDHFPPRVPFVHLAAATDGL